MGKELLNSNKELLLKDLCGRLPYKIYAQVPDEYGGYTSAIESIDIDGFVTDFEGAQIEIENIKPYLFPLSSMTEEQKKDIFCNGKFLISNRNELCRFPMHNDDYDYVTIDDYLMIYKKLIANHFDVNGLIEKGLAIDVTGLNIY